MERDTSESLLLTLLSARAAIALLRGHTEIQVEDLTLNVLGSVNDDDAVASALTRPSKHK